MFMILPLPASRMAGTKACVRKKMCRRLTLRLKSQASGVVARVERRVWEPAEAALFTVVGRLGWIRRTWLVGWSGWKGMYERGEKG
jgi:hypothetical protein